MYTGAFVFGHSLVDAGNALKLANKYDDLPFTKLPEGAPSAERGYFEGRFSDGYVLTDLIANKLTGAVTRPVFPFGYEDPWLGLPISPFKSDTDGNNLNFAYGGAKIRQGSEVVPDLDGQTDAFRDAVDGQADPGALYMVSMGDNDVRSLAPAETDPVNAEEAYARLDSAADRMLEELTQLLEIGVRHLLITGIADIGIIPDYDLDANLMLDATEQMRARAATDYSTYLDNLIRTNVLPALEGLGATITYVPLASFADGTGQGATGAMDAILPTLAELHGLTAEQISSDWLQFQDVIFFDHVHPTGQLHALAGSYMVSQLTGAPWAEILPLAGAVVDFTSLGSIAAAGEVDLSKIALAAGTTYTFEMLGMSSLGTMGALGDTSLRLLDSTSMIAAFDDDSGPGFDARLSFKASEAGLFTLEAGATGAVSGAYLLQAAVDGRAATSGNRYLVDDAAILVLEPALGRGRDVVVSSVSYKLEASSEIELLRTDNHDGLAAIDLTGNDFGQKIVGNNGANILDGGGGSDVIVGGRGADIFVFSSELDGSVDTIRDFNAKFDFLALDDAIFGGPPGALPAEWFALGLSASDPLDRIIFDPFTRNLYYDADGSEFGAALHFATLRGPHLDISASDFLIV
jgi:phospholipase/lecithinase/hemolysin